MKKTVLSIAVFAICTSLISAQLMDTNGYSNTLWSAFGNFKTPDVTEKTDEDTIHKDHVEWNGFLDTFQARILAGALTIDTMLQWGAETNYGSDSSLDSMTFRYKQSDVNFILKTIKNLDLGMGTNLNWKLGPAPAHDGYSWEKQYHVRQGGLSYGKPGDAPVTGATYYANYINESFDKSGSTVTTQALAGRFFVDDILQFAAAIPTGTTTDDFVANGGVLFTPNEKIALSAAFNRILHGDGNLYTGGSFMFAEFFSLDAWFACDYIGGENDNGQTATGAALNITYGDWAFKPEAGLTFYESSNYTTAGYTGINVQYEISETMSAGLWGSFAVGSENKKWDDSSSTKNWTGGSVLDIRPNFTYYFKTTDALSSTFEFQRMTTYKNKDYSNWSFGFYWKHVF